ncbi:hypothetical protein RI129_000726 [Pyrocoelia pectoralis]|uniref:Biogenesis of lysosome-related organelles complex 1 subunit 3 n=1 Tax=Pyrocoelia pectoralis TaxID=417401 RepID=A0AAN7ZR96_9COLE
MINSSVIISGEASETDSDEDNCKVPDKIMTTSIQAAIVTGEDSESDDENQGSISSAVSVLTQETVKSDREHHKNDSLLHKKLRECNDQLCIDLNMFSQNVISQAGKNLTAIDQELLKSQNTLQTAVTSLRSLHLNSVMIKEKLQTVLSSKFLSNIK